MMAKLIDKKTKKMTEKQMYVYKVGYPETLSDVINFIRKLENEADDYGKAAHCAALAGESAFNYICHREGLTGFQASYAALHLYGKIMHIDGPFIILKLNDYLYPQYNLHDKLDEFISSGEKWIKRQARKNIKNNPSAPVVAHWKKLAANKTKAANKK